MLQSQPIWFLNKYKHCVQDTIIFECDEGCTQSQIVNLVAQEVSRSFSEKSLEVSIYANDMLGKSLAYENLWLDGYPLLSVFRSGFVGNKTGPFPELIELSPQDSLQQIYSYSEQLLRFCYFDGDKTFTFQNDNYLSILAYLDFLYTRSVFQKSDISSNISIMLQQYKYITDVSYVAGSTILTPANSVCFLKYIFQTSYSSMIDELLNNAELFVKVHKTCFRKDMYE